MANTRTAFSATLLLIFSLLLSACAAQEQQPDKRYLAVGDTVDLITAIDIPHHVSHVNLQFGEILKQRDINRYQINCYLDNPKLGPFTLETQSYKVTKIINANRMYSDLGPVVNYYIEASLEGRSRGDALVLRCQSLDDHMTFYDFPLSQLIDATAGYLNFPE